MENNTNRWPIYAKLSTITIGLIALFFLFYIGKEILAPIVFSIIIAILLNPVVNFLCKKKINKIIAILISVITTFVLIVALVYFIFSQVTLFGESLPLFKEKFTAIFKDMMNWASSNLNVSKPKIETWLTEVKKEGMKNSSATLGTALAGIGGLMVLLLLIPVYIFMFLYYKPLILEFISKLFKNSKTKIVTEVLMKTKSLIQSYLIGLLIEAAIVATLNSIGLLVLGIQYAILIAIIGALLNLIPYIGGLVAISIPMLIALATKSPEYVIWVFILFITVQIIDNNYIVPKIVASKVKVNALVSIVVVLFGGALWGVAGMFLALPLTAIIKVIFDRIPALEPFGFIIGDNQTETIQTKHKIIKRKT